MENSARRGAHDISLASRKAEEAGWFSFSRISKGPVLAPKEELFLDLGNMWLTITFIRLRFKSDRFHSSPNCSL